jgi:anti-sigma factor RsiW
LRCRRINELLSAYLDNELTAQERWEVCEHLERCVSCRRELMSLSQTKSLLGSLACKATAADLERLLVSDPNASSARGRIRPGTILVTAMLSLAGMWLASTRLGGPVQNERALEGTFRPGTLTAGAYGAARSVTALVRPDRSARLVANPVSFTSSLLSAPVRPATPAISPEPDPLANWPEWDRRADRRALSPVHFAPR